MAQADGAVDLFDRLRILEELALLEEPGEIQWKFRKGLAQFDVGRVAAAIETFESCQPAWTDDPRLTLNLGHAYSAIGRTDEAIACYHELIAGADDEYASAGYWSLADLKTYTFSDEQVADIQHRARILSAEVRHRFLLMFALGRALEQRGDFADAFDAMREANEQVAKSRPFDARGYQNLAATLAMLQRIPVTQHERLLPRPIFVVGMPRSGSTLIEQILASHSEVEATSELPFIENLARSLDRQGGFARALGQLSADQCRHGAQAYLERVKPFLQAKPSAFVDKWPNNFWYIGMIKSLFPDARIVNIMRDPVDNAIGVYRQYFNFGNEHSSRIQWIADYWEVYVAVLTHWDALYPGEVLHFSYEKLVREPERQVGKLLEYCGLGFEERVLAFHDSDRIVMTPSGSQVRQPLNDRAIGSGMRYRAQLADFFPRFERIRETASTVLEA